MHRGMDVAIDDGFAKLHSGPMVPSDLWVRADCAIYCGKASRGRRTGTGGLYPERAVYGCALRRGCRRLRADLQTGDGVRLRAEIARPAEVEQYMNLGVKHFTLSTGTAILSTFYRDQGSALPKLVTESVEAVLAPA